MLNATGLPLQDLVFGASVYFPPFFKAFAFGFVIWLVVHRLLRGWIYAGFIAVCDLRLPCPGNTDCVVTMSIKTIKYFSTIIVAVVAVLAGWWLWNYYMQSPWTRDGKIRAEQVSITPQVSGRIVELDIKDNQLVNAGDLLLTIDKTPFQIAELNAQA